MPVADSSASESWKSWILVSARLLVSNLARIVEIFALWQSRSTARSCLGEFDERLLRDMGLTRVEALREINKPFWRE
ncbi:MAG: DUF1127 domain-containing protein [Rhodospirillales bacterium]|nr:DUF1127 domain-containing protein [Rhodospirillales bacterium]